MKITQNTSRLCGHFSTLRWLPLAESMQRAGWQAATLSEEARADSKNYYYGEFVDFSHHCPNPNDRRRYRRRGPDGIVRYHKPVDKEVVLGLDNGRSVAVRIGDVEVCLAPFGIVLFSIAVEMKEVEYNDMARALLTMRDLCRYDREAAGAFAEAAIAPVYEVYRMEHPEAPSSVDNGGRMNYHMLAENGNKLKLFQIVESECLTVAAAGSAVLDRALYNAGCLIPMEGLPEASGEDDRYYDRVMEQGRVAVFNDWRALALLDSFSILAAPLPDFRRNIWTNDYYGLIYTYTLFRHAFLLQYNELFRAHDCDIKRLEAEILLFERRYCYDRFSYNFLPLEIGHAIERALELPESTEGLHNMVTQASAVYDKNSDDKMNRALTLLTVITICSTIWDLFSLIDAAGAFPNPQWGFRLGIGILVLLLLTLYLIFFQTQHRRR